MDRSVDLVERQLDDVAQQLQAVAVRLGQQQATSWSSLAADRFVRQLEQLVGAVMLTSVEAATAARLAGRHARAVREAEMLAARVARAAVWGFVP